MEQKYVMAAIDAALKAGENILSIYDDPASDFEIERKADNSPLTIADSALAALGAGCHAAPEDRAHHPNLAS